MRKITIVILTIILIVFNTNIIFASSLEKDSLPTIKPYYNATFYTDINFSITSNIAKGKLTLKCNKSVNVDKVVADIKIINYKTGRVIKTWQNARLANTAYDEKTYTISKQHELKSKGVYYMQATVKVYSGSKLKDSISIKSLPDNY